MLLHTGTQGNQLFSFRLDFLWTYDWQFESWTTFGGSINHKKNLACKTRLKMYNFKQNYLSSTPTGVALLFMNVYLSMF